MTSEEVLANMLAKKNWTDQQTQRNPTDEASNDVLSIQGIFAQKVMPAPLAQMLIPRAPSQVMLQSFGNDVGGYQIVQAQAAGSTTPIKKKIVRVPAGTTLGDLELYDHAPEGKPQGYRFRFVGGPGGAEKCKWIQFYKQCYSCKKVWSEVINGKTVKKEEWVNVRTSDSNKTGGNGGQDTKVDCATWYVDSADVGGTNETGYVEGSGMPGGEAGTKGSSGNKNVAEMKDAAGYLEPADAQTNARSFQDFRNRENRSGALQPAGAQYVSFKVRMDFAAYLVCDGAVRTKVTWWYEFVERAGNYESSKGISEVDSEAQGMEDVHFRAVSNFETGGRLGAQ
jgi:hypothetical protein